MKFLKSVLIACVIDATLPIIGKTNNNTRDTGVVINGVRWATRNVGAPGTFVDNLWDAGQLFTWKEAQNACPKGWRLPTATELWLLEFRSRGGSDWTAMNGVNGRIFGDSPRQVFLPAAGFFGDRRIGVGVLGFYWSSTLIDTDFSLTLHLNDLVSNVVMGIRYDIRYSVRCVAISPPNF